MNAFDRATRRLMRRLGIPIILVDEDNNQHTVKAEVIEAEEFIAKGKGGNSRISLSMLLDNPLVQIATADCPKLTVKWRILIDKYQYEIVKEPLRKHGLTEISLKRLQDKQNLSWIDEPGN
ncbi:head-tail joining protein [Spartinivicinus poritis]|uniref:Uncharacterized protein n=1 Tax=Spartinivicinus poritis TaxID=2994640 RepID=A0ABT5UKC0_9GAMM|nr:hypothetical protein [Spartinivicinus sp. A2-2]MDE1465927.1 hypothetical protein [Spartinivicinus sp. A2-2]